MVTIDGIGHLMPLENPDLIASMISDTLKKISNLHLFIRDLYTQVKVCMKQSLIETKSKPGARNVKHTLHRVYLLCYSLLI